MAPPADDGDHPMALTVQAVGSLDEVAREDWDRLANPQGAEFDPFISWDFLQALEQSGCIGEGTGWLPRHLIARDARGDLVGSVPLYVKSHSMGEYVFDQAWADAYERAGGRYYPKLLTAVPFSPVTGRRILAASADLRHAMIQATCDMARRWGVSGWHVNFPTGEQRSELATAGLLPRIDRQYVWRNRSYNSYDDFLADLSSRKRKALRKERTAAQSGITIEHLSGEELRPEHWDVFYACYQETGSRKWGFPYLNRTYFDLLHQRMADRVLLVMAKKDGRYIAAALNLVGSHALYGRYWGKLEDHPFLHFELCYHQAIDAAIARGLHRVEAGAQGEHKLARGYAPTEVHSAHFIENEAFGQAVGQYLEQERAAVRADIRAQDADSPFRKDLPE
ncbi:GNAT family N-acetyltransferase [Maricaulis maris]|uniref:GNAT family N-acetyltransferase n=1 Tax=Maricaulis maris TaxID=74318 RepID=UPI0026EBD3C9|nr:GNAT family N-acetyltransferase [Maricaulis maris]